MSDKTTWGIAGIGKLGTAILTQWEQLQLETGIYHPDSEKAGTVVNQFPSARQLAQEDLAGLDYLILALPADQIIPFITDLKSSGVSLEKPVLINMATKMPTEELKKEFPDLKWAGMKFVGHSESLKIYGDGLFITEAENDKDESLLNRYTALGRVETTDESLAEKVNKLATYHAVKAARELEKQMSDEGYSDVYREQALRSLMPEVIRAYSKGKLGHFGKKIVEELDGENSQGSSGSNSD
ncbi:hypothetical protein K8O68_03785 [Salipaludibacillus sp. CUR1]|uniref:hypothetical protein n=1 Tax=Salipaludibacillus sp. CUR1 TaxID=2820003 RepID=UPI001E3CD636|nr:hypothetical protein [Salipaludibacillus sp. CUR1]MCE7791546.1 hypothetical protein [Salipaludibacillus sp. CUR1]